MNNEKIIPAINWNKIEDMIDKMTWDKLTEQFWLDTRIPVGNDMDDWRTIGTVSQEVINKSFAGLTLLDTLQSETGVASLMPDAITPHEEAVYTNIQFMECLTEESKLVTPKGLKSVRDIKKGELVLQYNIDGSSEFKEVLNVSSHVPKEIHQFETSKFTLKTSPGHRMYLEEKTLKNNECDDWKTKEVEAKDYGALPKTAHYRNILSSTSFKSKNKVRQLTPIERMLIAIQADGTIRSERLYDKSKDRITINIGFSKKRKINRFDDIIEQVEDNSINFTRKQEGDYVNFYISLDKDKVFNWGLDSNKEFDKMFDLSTFTQETAKEFIDELKHWDSHVAYHGEEVITYYTSNENNFYFVQAVSALASLPFKTYIHKKGEYKTSYSLRITKIDSSYYMSMQGKVIETLLPPEKVYGIEVPSTYLYVVTPKGPIITGNCVHAKSYSTIFSTFNTNNEIDDIFTWIKDNPYLQYKANVIEDIYLNGTPLQRKAASVLLESFLFYSGFYTPLRFAGEGKMTNSANIIKLIIRDESVHGTYIGYKFKKGFDKLNEDEQTELKNWVYDTAFDLYENEVEYTKDLYTEIGWTQDVINFVEYNLNKALINMGFSQLFQTTASDVDPVVINGLSTESSNHDFFSQVGDSYILGIVEEVDSDDFSMIENLIK